MRLSIFSSLLVALMGIGCTGSQNDSATVPADNSANVPTLHVVEITQMKFVPDVVNVNKGDTILWINKDMVDHDVTEQKLHSWTSSRLPAGASWKMVATKSDAYYCSLHVIMEGKIIVDGNDLAMTASARDITMCGSRAPNL